MQAICTNCERQYEKNQSGGALAEALTPTDLELPVCYNCALRCLMGKGLPESSDFTTAKIISGEMTEREWLQIQEDLRAAEEGRSPRELFFDDGEGDYNPFDEDEDCPMCWYPGKNDWCTC